jgi:hypothetical protein
MAEQRDGWAKAEIFSKIISALFLPIVLLVLGTWISQQQRKAEQVKSEQQRMAEQIKLEAENNANRLTTMLKFLASDSPRERLLATKVTVYFGEKNQLPPELVPVLVEVIKNDESMAVADSAIQSLTKTAETNKALGPDIEKTLAGLPARVYIQIASESQRERGKHIREKLTEEGLLVPGIQNIGGKAEIPKTTDVRYFNDQDKITAETIAQILRSNGVASASPHPVRGMRAKPGTLEIWFSRND